MPEYERPTRILKASEARQQFSRLVNQVFRKEARILVEKSGIPVAAIVSASDLERLNRIDEQRERDFAILDEIGEAFKDVSEEELQEQLDLVARERVSDVKKSLFSDHAVSPLTDAQVQQGFHASQQADTLIEAIRARRRGAPLADSADRIRQAREERSQQLLDR